MSRIERVIAFCDWLDTIPSDPPFFRHPDFARFADLSDDERRAAAIEMKRRASVDIAEAEALHAEVLGNARKISIVIANDE